MKISIIIPAYNSEKTIEKCLNSIINQTYKNLEIIVIDDGSTDTTSSICKNYCQKDSRIQLIKKPNSGVSATRNLGITKCTGDYTTFIDSDDFIELNTIETLVLNLNEDLDFIRYNFKVAGANIKPKDSLYELRNKKILVQEKFNELLSHFLTFNNSIPNYTPLLIIKTSLLKTLEFDTSLSMLEDADFYNKLFLKSKKALFLDEKMYNYYVNLQSVTHSEDYYIKNINSVLKANSLIIERCQKIISPELVQNINAAHLNVIGNFLFKIFKNNKKEYFQTLTSLKNNSEFQRMIKNYNTKGMAKVNSYLIALIKRNHKIIQSFYLNIVKLLYKILRG